MKRIMILVVATLMVMTLPSFAHANMLLNPGFEDGTYTVPPGEDGIPEPWWKTGSQGWTSWKNNSEQAHTGSKYMGAGADGGKYSFWAQNVAGITEGDVVTLSAYVKTEMWGTPTAKLQVEFVDGGGVVLRTDASTVLTAQDATWAFKTMTTAGAPTGTLSANFMLLGGNSGTVLFDDGTADAVPIPEPTSLLLLGTGLAGLLILKKK